MQRELLGKPPAGYAQGEVAEEFLRLRRFWSEPAEVKERCDLVNYGDALAFPDHFFCGFCIQKATSVRGNLSLRAKTKTFTPDSTLFDSASNGCPVVDGLDFFEPLKCSAPAPVYFSSPDGRFVWNFCLVISPYTS